MHFSAFLLLTTAVCPDMLNPANGIMIMTGTAVGDTATYTCDPGHELVGAPTLTCLGDGQWSDPPPVCQFIGMDG